MIQDLFASYVFPRSRIEALLTPQERSAGHLSSMETADKVAEAMKNWALSQGATHYCHWFQPLTGATAEKHMSFLSPAGSQLLQFTGKQLLMGESDASSFPTGGLRQTAYAQGCTAWDQSSPVFLKETAAGKVLCIPTVFLSPTGETLDFKTPLLRSMEAISTQACRLLRCFGKQVRQVTPMVGAEQEYFLIDRQRYLQRPDLRYCGRTLFGAPAPKGQEMDDQYYAAIPARAGAFMQTVNRTLWKLGIPAAAQHNEVAPAQYELAPQYAPAHIASDQNQLIMESLQSLARQQGLVCLLHEKPFSYINGSGKHINWSLSCDSGENLLDPGADPKNKLQFPLILACILQAVDTHGDLLRLSAGTVGNDLRLGGQEAPPVILSVFLGQEPEELLLGGDAARGPDRNRTAPLAFNGNRLEFRMVGASDSIAMATTVLNTIVAESFCQAAQALEEGQDCRELIRRLLQQHGAVVYNGDCYCQQWAQEAIRRGLPAFGTLVEAIPALNTPKAQALFGQFGVFTPAELESRVQVLYETYAKRMAIEARTMLHIVQQKILPAGLQYLHQLTGPNPVERNLARRIEGFLQALDSGRERLERSTQLAASCQTGRQGAQQFVGNVVPAMEALRRAADGLEGLLPRDFWPMPTYGELLFDI